MRCSTCYHYAHAYAFPFFLWAGFQFDAWKAILGLKPAGFSSATESVVEGVKTLCLPTTASIGRTL